ncbi:MAG: hypothetical protein GXP31_08270 [Kiritimatiellaeota bacterium]|nr:hypothetical protein [Kiritimatiellota bacterium]
MPDWPHAPPHKTLKPGTYMVTAGTLHKKRLLDTPEKLSLVTGRLLSVLPESGWSILAWAVLSNHYHVVISQSTTPESIGKAIRRIHGASAHELNLLDSTPKRRVWYQFWDSQITFLKSYFARLQYVNENPVHHGLVARAVDYPWCSAGWYEQRVDAAFRKRLAAFKTDRVRVVDDFD